MTPSPHQPIPQASPREPHFAFPTFKPPALYPSKKQKFAQAASYSHCEFTCSSLPRFLPQATNAEMSSYGKPLNERSILASDPLDLAERNTHRPSLQPLQTLNLGSARIWEARTSPPSDYITPSSNRSFFDGPNMHYRSPEQTPTSSVPDSTLPRPLGLLETRGSYVPASNQLGLRRLSYQSCEDFASTFQHQYPMRQLPLHRELRYSIPQRGRYTPHADDFTPEQQGQRGLQYARAVNQPCGPSDSNTMFAPSHYEYQHGKARKRSNLPKQSTEIMKNWFDQVRTPLLDFLR